MKLYFVPRSRAERIAWLLEELGLAYELEFFASLTDPGLRSPKCLKMNLNGRVPTLQDGDTVISETGAIVQYVLAKYAEGRLVPDMSSPEFAAYLQWLHYSEGMIMPPLGTIVVETVLLPPEKRSQVIADRAAKLLSRLLNAVNVALEGRDFLAGEFSGADIMTGHACIMVSRIGTDFSDKPNVAAYIERLISRPAFKRAAALKKE